MKIDFTKTAGPIKRMNAVNNGPMRQKTDQIRDNYESYKALAIPFARNHDAAFCTEYGAEHGTDIVNIFRNFDADVNDPASYDFTLTDEYLERMFSVRTEPFYRLGNKIEHEIKKYGTLPPPDFHKWAEICEHIIRHYTEGWADGFHWNIRYWEIWNEADGAKDEDDYYWHKCWGGTKAQFFDLYEITAKHLKKCFPHLKIGGPAVCAPNEWLDDFLAAMHEREVPIDFVSWHTYAVTPEQIADAAKCAREMMVRNGYGDAESFLDEWNYVRGWTDDWVYSIEMMIGMKGAAFIASSMIAAQNAPVDMLMYYDARPCGMNGLWDYYTARPLHGYYSFGFFKRLADLGTQVVTDAPENGVYTLAATDAAKEKGAVMVAVYTDDDADKTPRTVTLNLSFGKIKPEKVALTFLDKRRKGTKKKLTTENGRLTLTLPPRTVVLVEV